MFRFVLFCIVLFCFALVFSCFNVCSSDCGQVSIAVISVSLRSSASWQRSKESAGPLVRIYSGAAQRDCLGPQHRRHLINLRAVLQGGLWPAQPQTTVNARLRLGPCVFQNITSSGSRTRRIVEPPKYSALAWKVGFRGVQPVLPGKVHSSGTRARGRGKSKLTGNVQACSDVGACGKTKKSPWAQVLSKFNATII